MSHIFWSSCVTVSPRGHRRQARTEADLARISFGYSSVAAAPSSHNVSPPSLRLVMMTWRRSGKRGSRRKLPSASLLSSLVWMSSVSPLLLSLRAIWAHLLTASRTRHRRRLLPPLADPLGFPNPAPTSLRRGAMGSSGCARVGPSARRRTAAHPLHFGAQGELDGRSGAPCA